MKLQWLNQRPSLPIGVNWGIPWKQGELQRADPLRLEDVDIQSWPMAFWPDGSVKWTGHAAVFKSEGPDLIQLKKGTPKQQNTKTLKVKESEQQIQVNTGNLQCVINKAGKFLIESLQIDGVPIGSKGHLVAVKAQHQEQVSERLVRQITLTSEIEKVVVERKGPIQCVIKIEGVHGTEKCLPFTVRLYFFVGLSHLKLIHTFFYDGNPDQDFVKGIGFKFSVAVKGQLWNRHARFAGETGMYNEAAQLLLSRRFRKSPAYEDQIAGKLVPIEAIDNAKSSEHSVLENAKVNAVWHDFKLVQHTVNTYQVAKRTTTSCAWIDGIYGQRGKGLVYAGGEQGGVAVALKDFWQKYPAAIEVNQLGTPETTMTLWFWSPDGAAMDLRHYSETTHVKSAYEGFDERRATPYGIANTSEAYLKLYAQPPENQALIAFADYSQEPALLICEPSYYHETKALGIWSLPDYTTTLKAFLEEQMDQLFKFYLAEIQQRHWYGYWHYGDVMHTYDPIRHQWYYDMGGYAWQNTELVPNLWLWYAFLRTGRADIFKVAAAMARHTSEVDRYHFGEYAGLGSRHNVSHWGCGCKEARISMAGLQKYYYFLTTDDRMNELLTETKDADLAIDGLDPMREFYGDGPYETHARVGPDWAAFCSNWLSQWERTEDLTYRHKIITGLNNLKYAPYRLLSGPTYGYNTKTSELLYMGTGNEGGYHMVIAFGAPQVWMELADLLEDDQLKDMIAEFGQVYLMSDSEKRSYSNGLLTDHKFHWSMFAAGMAAYGARRLNNQQLAQKAWNLLLKSELSGMKLPVEIREVESWKPLREVDWVTTNVVSQWCLNVIVALQLIGDQLLDEES